MIYELASRTSHDSSVADQRRMRFFNLIQLLDSFHVYFIDLLLALPVQFPFRTFRDLFSRYHKEVFDLIKSEKLFVKRPRSIGCFAPEEAARVLNCDSTHKTK